MRFKFVCILILFNLFRISAQTNTDSTEKNHFDFMESINDVEIKMIAVNGTRILRRSKNDRHRPASNYVQTIQVSDFYIAQYEISQKQWEAIMQMNPSYFKDCSGCPVENVSWYDSQEFLKKLNALTGKTYRLPTAAEWEVATYGGRADFSTSTFRDNPGSSSLPNKTEEVFFSNKNSLYIYGLDENVSEWCSDWYEHNYLNASSFLENPKGPDSGTEKVIKGGNWADLDDYCIEFHCGEDPNVRSNTIGFRIVLDRD